MDAWWRRQFARLLDHEQAGRDPGTLASRWLALDLMRFDRRGRLARVTVDVPEDVAHFLDDADIRRKDMNYAARQRAAARRWLDG